MALSRTSTLNISSVSNPTPMAYRIHRESPEFSFGWFWGLQLLNSVISNVAFMFSCMKQLCFS